MFTSRHLMIDLAGGRIRSLLERARSTNSSIPQSPAQQFSTVIGCENDKKWSFRKEAGWLWYHLIGLSLRCSRGNFQTNLCWPHPARGLKLLREPCFCHLKAIIVSQ
jgi:hypothetical protein